MTHTKISASAGAAKKRNITMQRLFTRAHVFLYRLSGGAIGGCMDNSSVLLLTTTGRKSGKQYTTPVLYLADESRWVIVASYAGSPTHPTWWLNLKANLQAQVEIERKTIPVVATEANAEERANLWPKLVAMNSQYTNYEKKTNREFPIVILSQRE